MATDADESPRPAEPAPDLLPDVQVRLEMLVRRLDLLERRVAHREDALGELKGESAPVVARGETLSSDVERLDDLDARVGRLERKGFAPTPGGAAIDFARFEPQEARAGEAVALTMRLEGFRRGDKIEVTIVDVHTGEASDPLVVELAEDAPAGVSIPWKAPAPAGGRPGAFRFTARGRDAESRSPVLTVRG